MYEVFKKPSEELQEILIEAITEFYFELLKNKQYNIRCKIPIWVINNIFLNLPSVKTCGLQSYLTNEVVVNIKNRELFFEMVQQYIFETRESIRFSFECDDFEYSYKEINIIAREVITATLF